MPRWTVEAVWKDHEVFIIGGGHSLKSFDFSVLEDERTIGCNSAFILGANVCKVCIFGDARWFEIFQHELKHFKGAVFTNAPSLLRSKTSWLWTMGRQARGLHKNALGWNKNTGASAINLALLFGAKKIFLLGFDMHLSRQGDPNWHHRLTQKPIVNNYEKFMIGFGHVAADLKRHWSEVKVVNVTDNSSLEHFEKVGVKEFWENRRKWKV